MDFVISNLRRLAGPTRGASRFLAALALLLLLVGGGDFAPAAAQTAAATSGGSGGAAAQAQPDMREIDRLVQTLEDPAKRTALLDQLRALRQVERTAEPAPQPAGFATRLVTLLSAKLDQLGGEITDASAVVVNLPQGVRWLRLQVESPASRANWVWLTGELALVIVTGHLVRLGVIRLLRRPRAMLAARPSHSVITKLPLLLVRALLDLAPIAAFAAGGFGVLVVIDPPNFLRLLGVSFLNASIFVQAVRLALRAILSPASPNLRLLPMSDASARRALVWGQGIATVGVYGLFAADVARTLGLPTQSYQTLVKLVGLVVTVMLVALVLQSRGAVASWLRGEMTAAPAPVTAPMPDGGAVHARRAARTGQLLRATGRRIAEVWHIVAILYIVVLFFIWALDIQGGLEFLLRATGLTLLAAVVARLLVRGINGAATAALRHADGDSSRAPGLRRRVYRYVGTGAQLLRWTVGALTVVTVLDVWGLGASDWFQSAAGWRIVASGLSILVMIGIALGVWETSDAVIERHLASIDRNGRAVQRSARVRTLLPLLRSVVMVTLIILVTLTLLSELGLNIGPLLAGAGVVGVAVGFGAQTLVKDIINGLFILFEDTIAVGDVANVAGKGGLVEAITIRTIRLRDFDGTVHTIPFSAVTSISNMTKDFSFYVFDVAVAYHENVERVTAALHEIGEGLRKDPRFSPLILEPLEVFGVDAFQDSAVLIKARIKTLPIQQWNVGREFNGRMKKRFDELGITIPFPQRTLHIAGDSAPLSVATPSPRRAGAAE